MKFIIDECLSHLLTRDFIARGYPDTVHPIHIGLRGTRDDTILAKALAEDRIIVTANAGDFRRLLAATPVHSGAIIVEVPDRPIIWQVISAALAFIEMQPHTAD